MEKFYFDNSMICDFAKCKAQGLARHKFGRRGKTENLYAELGSAGHNALELHFLGKSEDAVMNRLKLEYDKAIPPGILPEAESMYKQNVVDIFQHWVKTHPVESFSFVVIEAEKNETIEIEPGYVFSMKRDLLAQDKQSGFYYAIDHKFRWGKITPWWTDKFKLNSQISGYIWGTKEYLKNEMGKEASDQLLVNAISMAPLPKTTRKCRDHKVPYSECRLLHSDFRLIRFTRSPQQIEAWKKDVMLLAKEMKNYFDTFQDIEMLQYVPRTGAFSDGCTFCSFQKWCRTGFNPNLVEELTVYDRWKPWEELPF